jgi:hypothetical protein
MLVVCQPNYGALVNICHVFIALFWDPIMNIIPCEKILLGPDPKYFGRKTFYGISMKLGVFFLFILTI